jgi:hypothetical protein
MPVVRGKQGREKNIWKRELRRRRRSVTEDIDVSKNKKR